MAYTKGLIGQLHTQFGDKPFTYKDAGVHFATLNALVNRDYLTKQGSHYRIAAKGLLFNRIEEIIGDREFISLRKQNSELGMLCSLKGQDVLDAWGNTYPLDDVVEYTIGFNDWEKIFQ